jgi:hypothetical protein
MTDNQNQNQENDSINNMVLQSPELLSAIEVINTLDKWEFMRTYEPPFNYGYMFDTNATIQEITSKIVEGNPGHSGASMSITMRTIKFLSKHGSKTLNYLRRRNYLFFLENLKQTNRKILNDDILKEIGKFL